MNHDQIDEEPSNYDEDDFEAEPVIEKVFQAPIALEEV